LPFVKASASGVAEPPTVAATKAVVANCVELVPGIAVGAVGVPVNEGDAIVARNNMSAVFAVILDVFEVILVLKFDSALEALVISAVILAVLEAIEFVLLVILTVLATILVSKAFSALVALVTSAVILAVLEVILVFNPDSALVALEISAVILAVLEAIELVLLVILAVLESIKVGKVVIVDELTPPTLFTVGKFAVPPKSFVSFNTPFVLDVASGAPDPPTNAATNAVVASCVELVPGAAVGAVGVPVNDGDAMVALNNISAVFAVILNVFAAIEFVLLVILAVLEVILVSNEFSALEALIISAVILAVLDVILVLKVDSAFVALVISAVLLAVFAAIALVLLVILAVFDAIKVGKVAIVDELTPPTVLIVVVNVPVPLPLTSPVNVIN